jgi:undecaprenyl-diphosphatase
MWVWYGASIFVALSRVVRGSHFPTDVFAGALLGYLVGYVLVRNLRDWRSSLVNALVVGLPFFVGAFGVVWVIFNQHSAGTLQEGMIGGGILVILLGCGVLWSLKREIRPLAPIDMIGKAGAGLMIAFGFAVFTESLVITLLTILAASFWWLFRSHPKVSDLPHELRKDNRRWGHPSEIFILLGIGVALVVLHQLKGLVPLM